MLQEQHKLQSVWRTEEEISRRKAKGKKRTHRLCNLGGMMESVAPEVKNSDTHRNDRADGTHLFGLPEVQRAVRHMAITHINQANREKELKANGTISLSVTSNPNETQVKVSLRLLLPPIVPAKSIVQRVLRRIQRLHQKGVVLSALTFSCRPMHRKNTQTVRPYGTQLKKPSVERTPSLHTVLKFPCRMNFLLKKTSLWQGNFCWRSLSAGA